MKGELRHKIVLILIFLSIGIFIGWLIFGGRQKPEEDRTKSAEVKKQQIWTCSMHPQIRQTEPGKCPICKMELIPLETEELQADSGSLRMSETAMQLANIQTAVAGKMMPVKTLNLNGKVVKDERLVYSQSAHISGRVEKLMINFTGEYVSKGQTIAYIYSPELVTAQEELLEAYRQTGTQKALFESAKEKLYNWKITDSQIDEILKNGSATESFPVLADFSGYVSEIKVASGDYVQKGSAFFEIADLSRVWVVFDIYESDLAFVKAGDKINYTVQALPGETFQGKITYLDPVINANTRVLNARLEVNNYNMKLKPEMFVSGTLVSDIAVNTESVVIPKSAVLWTGKRSVVYVKSVDSEGISFKMREVTLGVSLGDSYVIESGLKPGEEIAVSGAFSIDAAAQLAGKPSMMNPENSKQNTGNGHEGMNMDMSKKENETTGKSGIMQNMLPSKTENTVKHEMFFVNGLCDMCKERIETAVRSVPGVVSAVWDVDTKTAHVEFDSGVTSLMKIHEAIAKAGHDTKLVKADDSGYNALPDCCRYRE